MKIWHQSYTDLSVMPVYARRLAEHAARVVEPSTEVHLAGVPAQAAPVPRRMRAAEFLRDSRVLENALRAEVEAFDALAIGCLYDPVLRECRSMVDIPVLALAENSLTATTPFARRVGLITLDRDEAESTTQLAETYGLADRLADCRPIDASVTETEIEALGDTWSPALLAAVHSAHASCVAAGADVVLLAEGVLNEYVVAAGQAGEEIPPVLDSLGLLWKQAESAARQSTILGAAVGRRLHYRRPDGDARERARTYFPEATWAD